MRSDPYARLLSIVDHYQRDRKRFTPQQEALIDNLRGEIPALMEARAKRLSDEASSLPPTHFLVLILLTALSLIGFTAATLSITDANGEPPLESRMVFAGLSAVYVLFFNFCKDMNDPFDGVYQIKRSSAASFLLQVKWLISQQPFGQDIKFDTRGFAPQYDGNSVLEIGKGSTKISADAMKLPTKRGQEELVAPEADTQTNSPPDLSAFEHQKPKEVSASTFLPDRKTSAAQKKAIDVSGNRGSQLASDVGSAIPKTMDYSPKATKPKAPVDKSTISMSFRKSSGFGQ